MSNFFDRFKPGAGDDKKNKNNSSKTNGNPLAGWFQWGTSRSTFSGQGQSLGGSQPGKVMAVTLSDPGSLGLQIEKSSQGMAIVAMVVPDSQASLAGLERGDVLCFAGSDGIEEIRYDMFLELASSHQRPLCFEVRRVPQTKAAGKKDSTATNITTTASSTAEAYARKQAMIAAAEKREQAHKKLTKPLPKKEALPKLLSTADRQKLEEERLQRLHDEQAMSLSAATQAALAQAKTAEQQTVSQLGYNPYEAKSMSAGQARNAVTVTTHGAIRTDPTASSSSAGAIPNVAAPRPLQATDDDPSPSSLQQQQQQQLPPREFAQAFETTVTSFPDHDAVVNSLTILRKLILNATTKGQDNDDEETAAKFRKIRLHNPKIQAAVTRMPGAVDLLLAVGFQLHQDDTTSTDTDEHCDGRVESVLLYPPGDRGPSWLPAALQQMERYVSQS